MKSLKASWILIAGFILLIGVIAANNLALQAVLDATDRRADARKLLVQALTVLTTLQQAESSQRGYLLTGTDDYLVPYRQAREELPAQIERLKSMVAGIRSESVVPWLLPKIDAKVQQLDLAIEQFRKGEKQAALELLRADPGDAAMRDVHRLVDELSSGLLAELSGHAETVRQWTQYAQVAGWVSFFIAVAVVGSSFVLLLWEGQRRASVLNAAEKARVDLQHEYREHQCLERQLTVIVEGAPGAIVQIGPEGQIDLVNRQAERLFGYDRAELIGASVDLLVPEGLRDRHASLRRDYWAEPVARSMGSLSQTLYGQRKDGTLIPLEIGLNPIETPDGMSTLAVVMDVSERNRARQELERALQDKTRLLNELQLRIDEDLQLIASLCEREARHRSEPAVRELLEDSRRRARTMALVHRLAYQRFDFDRVDLGLVLSELGSLSNRELDSRRHRFEVSVTVSTHPVRLAMRRALPCALLVDELVVHGHRQVRIQDGQCHVAISLECPGSDEALLTVAYKVLTDPGPLPALENMALLTLLVEQIQGSHEVVREDGATFRLRFGLETG